LRSHPADAHLIAASGSVIMFTRLSLLAGLLVGALLVTAPASAGPNPNKGRTLFRSTCKTCHVKNGEAKDLSPLTKTQAQWTRVFKSGITPMVSRVQTKTGKGLTAADLTDLQVFLVAHAADSDQPETCGIR
jgi:cytochrome c5